MFINIFNEDNKREFKVKQQIKTNLNYFFFKKITKSLILLYF